jgi:hypothetical protein
MLASTVQFSNNNQPPTTPEKIQSSPGPAPKTPSNNARILRHPTACPTHPENPPPSTPKQY